MREDAERWDKRYEGRSTGGATVPMGLGGVALPDGGRCLDVACGLGEQSLWAAEVGFEVLAFDASPVAIGSLRAAAVERGLADRVDARVVDLDAGLPDDAVAGFDVVICQRFRDPRLYPQLAAAVAPGGVLVITVLSQLGAVDPGPFHAPAGDLLDGFGGRGLEIVRHIEADGEATLVGRRSAPV